MLEGAPIAWWIGFHVVVVTLIAVDLALPHRAEGQSRRDFLFVLLLLALAVGVTYGWVGVPFLLPLFSDDTPLAQDLDGPGLTEAEPFAQIVQAERVR